MLKKEGRPKWKGQCEEGSTGSRLGGRDTETNRGSSSHFNVFSFYPKGNGKSLKNL